MNKGQTTLAAVLLASTGLASGVSAQTACGQTYVVSSGDTLSTIAESLFGSGSGFRVLFEANSNVIGGNPNLIEVGMELIVPCLDDPDASTPNAIVVSDDGSVQINDDPAEETQTTQTTSVSREDTSKRAVLFVAGDDYAPFTGRDLPQGGMLVELVQRAMAKSRGSDGYRIDFVDDRAAHFDPLLKHNLYDFSIGWALPECLDPTQLTSNLSELCENYSYSVPLFDEPVQFYLQQDLPSVTSHAELAGLSVCEADGWSPESVLLQVGVSYTDITTSDALRSPADCIQAVADGQYDFTVMATSVAEQAINASNLDGAIAVNEDLETTRGLSAVISSDNPDRLELLSELNIGIFKVRLSGEWFGITSRHQNGS